MVIMECSERSSQCIQKDPAKSSIYFLAFSAMLLNALCSYYLLYNNNKQLHSLYRHYIYTDLQPLNCKALIKSARCSFQFQCIFVMCSYYYSLAVKKLSSRFLVDTCTRNPNDALPAISKVDYMVGIYLFTALCREPCVWHQKCHYDILYGTILILDNSAGCKCICICALVCASKCAHVFPDKSIKLKITSIKLIYQLLNYCQISKM